MTSANHSASKPRTYLFVWAILLVAGMAIATTNCQAFQASARRATPAQSTPKANSATAPTNQEWMDELKKNPELMTELGKLISRMEQEVQVPGPRRQSQILPRLNGNTNVYFALPNYGEALNQAHIIFKQQLKDSPALRDWWQKNAAKADPSFDDVLDVLYQFSQYLGDEIVASGSYKDKTGILIAQVKKPGLDQFLPEMHKKFAGKSDQGKFHVLTPQQLASANYPANDALALVRSDFVVIGSDLNALRAINAQIEARNKGFAATPFGQRMNQAYVDGASALLGVDLQPMVPDFTKLASQRALLQASGFGDMKYAVWEMNPHNGGAELSFTSSRHGIASWLANSGHLGGLDFLSPSATMAGSILLKSPAQILDDYRDFASTTNPGSGDMLAQMQMMLGIDLRNDLLSKLDGEIAYELDTPLPLGNIAAENPSGVKNSTPAAPPTWRLALRVNDAVGLQQTFAKLFIASHMEVKDLTEGKFTVHTFQIPSQPAPMKIHYTFADGYLLVGSNRAMISEALRVHQTGESLAKSAKFRAGLPDNQAQVASALFYQNTGSWMAMMMKQLPVELIQSLPQVSTMESAASVSAIYGSDRAIRATSGSNATSAAMVMIVAAIAIPNLQRSKATANAVNANAMGTTGIGDHKIGANESAAAAASMRTINTAQVTYTTSYPSKGYAADLASLGPGSAGTCDSNSITDAHACLLDAVLGNASCTSGKWCTKGGYNYSVKTVCRFGTCPGYVAVAIPVTPQSGDKSFCSVEDAVVRMKDGLYLAPVSAAECRRWAPIR